MHSAWKFEFPVDDVIIYCVVLLPNLELMQFRGFLISYEPVQNFVNFVCRFYCVFLINNCPEWKKVTKVLYSFNFFLNICLYVLSRVASGFVNVI